MFLFLTTKQPFESSLSVRLLSDVERNSQWIVCPEGKIWICYPVSPFHTPQVQLMEGTQKGSFKINRLPAWKKQPAARESNPPSPSPQVRELVMVAKSRMMDAVMAQHVSSTALCLLSCVAKMKLLNPSFAIHNNVSFTVFTVNPVRPEMQLMLFRNHANV